MLVWVSQEVDPKVGLNAQAFVREDMPDGERMDREPEWAGRAVKLPCGSDTQRREGRSEGSFPGCRAV